MWKVEGDPTEGALYPFAAKLGMDRQTEQAAYPRIDAIPFESEHRFMATLHKPPEGGEILLVKGAPEAILDNCDRQQTRLARSRSIALLSRRPPTCSPARASACWRLRGCPIPASRPGACGPADLPKNLVLLGLVGLLDPPRKEAIEAVQGMPRRRHPRDDDHRRPQDHRRGDREDARHRRRQDGGHRRRGRGNGHGDASGDGRQGRRVRPREPRAQAAAGQGDSGQRAGGGDDRRRRQRRAGA